MKSNSNDQQDAFQLLSNDERETLILALLEGAGGGMEAEALDAAKETAFDWAKKTRIESTVLELILRGDLMVRCRPDGELEFRPKIAKPSESLEVIETDRSLR